MSKPVTSIKIFSITDKGLEREHNEDYHLFCGDISKDEWSFFENKIVFNLGSLGSLLVLADGMGGMNAGEVASKLAVEEVQEYFRLNVSKLQQIEISKIEKFLMDSIKHANTKLINHQKRNPETEGMGTTMVVVWILENQLYLAWCGDSRCYISNQKSGLQQISRDHSHVQELIDRGKLTKEQAFYHPDSNIVTQSLGDIKHPPKSDFKKQELFQDDRVILCSDGLNSMLQDNQILKVIQENPKISDCGQALINAANQAGGHDNTTIIICDVSNMAVNGAAIKKKNKVNSLVVAAIFLFLIVFGYIIGTKHNAIKNMFYSNSSQVIKKDTLKGKNDTDSITKSQSYHQVVSKPEDSGKKQDTLEIVKIKLDKMLEELSEAKKGLTPVTFGSFEIAVLDARKQIMSDNICTMIERILQMEALAKSVNEIKKLLQDLKDIKKKKCKENAISSEPTLQKKINDTLLQISQFNNNLAGVKNTKTSKFGYIDNKNMLVIPCIYLDIKSFKEYPDKKVKAEVEKIENKTIKWIYIDKSGKKISDCNDCK